MQRIDFTFLVGGEAGAGVMLTGRVASKAFVRGGYWVFATNEYPSLIRGGHNWFLARVCDREVHSQRLPIDVIVALDEATVRKHAYNLSKRGLIIAEDAPEGEKERVVKIPMARVVKEEGAPPVAKNMVALGAFLGVLGYSPDLMTSTIKDELSRRGAKVAELNARLALKGYEYGKEYEGALGFTLKPLKNTDNLFLTGNDAIALGALAAGMRFYAAYPMTPASPILHFLAAVEDETGIVVLQPESEIAAINMVIGAAYAGARAMTATSGGGFSLMVEALGQAGMTETPIVVVEVQRPGPSTGLPTFTAQGDLRFVIHASQGEFPRFVIAPGDHEESFYLAAEAFNLAERYQVPVVILSDKYLGESYSTVAPFNADSVTIDRGKLVEEPPEEDYKRYLLTEDGISYRALPGTKGAIIRANSSEHDEEGFGTSDPVIVRAMVEKRLRKLELMRREVERREDSVKVYGDWEPRVTLIVWGSVKGPALEAIGELKERGVKAALVQVVFLEPFPAERLRKTLDALARPYLLVENNSSAQLGSLLKEHLCLKPDDILLKYDGRPFDPHEIASKAMEVARR